MAGLEYNGVAHVMPRNFIATKDWRGAAGKIV
jgi:hypothetical protein